MGTSSGQSAIGRRAGLLVALWLSCAAQPAFAQIDMNGPWAVQTIFGNSFICSLTFTQTGMSLSISGTCGLIGTVAMTGTIDPGTGNFSASGSGGSECPSLTFTLAVADLDNSEWFAGYVCSGGPNGFFQGAIQGHRCGNGIVDAITGEECDIAIHQCCSGEFFSCQLAPAGAFCSDGNQCTDDVCDGAGTCLHSDRSGACDDGNQCTGPDECMAGTCIAPTLPNGAPCEDFNDCTSQSCQTGECQVANLPDGTPCDDFFTCLEGETCSSGVCQLGEPVVCPACRTCQESDGCIPHEFPSHDFYGSLEDVVHLRKLISDSVRWRWTSASPLTPASFGDPVTTTGYELCIFDGGNIDPSGEPSLIFAASLPAGSNWKATRTGFIFKNAAEKIKVRLKAGEAGEAEISVRAKGAANPVQYLPPVAPPLDVQLRMTGGGFPQNAFFADYETPVISTDKRFKGEFPPP